MTKVSAEDGTLTILAEDSNQVLPRLFESAAAKAVRITSVDIQEPNLESVFLHLTGRALTRLNVKRTWQVPLRFTV